MGLHFGSLLGYDGQLVFYIAVCDIWHSESVYRKMKPHIKIYPLLLIDYSKSSFKWSFPKQTRPIESSDHFYRRALSHNIHIPVLIALLEASTVFRSATESKQFFPFHFTYASMSPGIFKTNMTMLLDAFKYQLPSLN